MAGLLGGFVLALGLSALMDAEKLDKIMAFLDHVRSNAFAFFLLVLGVVIESTTNGMLSKPVAMACYGIATLLWIKNMAYAMVYGTSSQTRKKTKGVISREAAQDPTWWEWSWGIDKPVEDVVDNLMEQNQLPEKIRNHIRDVFLPLFKGDQDKPTDEETKTALNDLKKAVTDEPDVSWKKVAPMLKEMRETLLTKQYNTEYHELPVVPDNGRWPWSTSIER